MMKGGKCSNVYWLIGNTTVRGTPVGSAAYSKNANVSR